VTAFPINIPTGLNSDDTALASSPAWVDGSNVRFHDGKAQAKGGWESVTQTLLSGVCRLAFPWTDNAATLNVAFGTHTHLQIFQGGAVFDITPSSGFTPGAIDGAGSSGFGTGAFGIGGFGSPSSTDYFPLTWSAGAYGQTLMASPRNQTIFQWSNATGTPAVAVTNAPAQVTYMLVTPQRQVMALGCSQEVGGVFNPNCIRHSDVGSPTGWSTIASSSSTSREYVLPGGGRIVAGRVMGSNVLIWTSDALWLGTYVGQVTQVWRFDKVGDKCGLAGPGAAIVAGSTAFWVSPDRQFHTYSLNGFVQPVTCPIRQDFADNLAASQNDKIVASSVAEYNEIRFDYPDSRDGYENSRYVSLRIAGPDVGKWHRGIMARTSMVDAGPSLYPCGTTYAGNVYWHEKGNSADGANLAGFIESANLYLDEDSVMLVRSSWPDIADQIGPLSLTLTGRFYPQGDPTVVGPITLQPGQDQADFKAKARLFRVRIDFNSSPSFFRLGLITFDAKQCGRR
jgi:hypothetical protein